MGLRHSFRGCKRVDSISSGFLILPDARLISETLRSVRNSGADSNKRLSSSGRFAFSFVHDDLAATHTFHPSTMHLMYTIDENGSRVYTLKVSRNYSTQDMVLTDLQKITETGKITKSAHPGSLF